MKSKQLCLNLYQFRFVVRPWSRHKYKTTVTSIIVQPRKLGSQDCKQRWLSAETEYQGKVTSVREVTNDLRASKVSQEKQLSQHHTTNLLSPQFIWQPARSLSYVMQKFQAQRLSNARHCTLQSLANPIYTVSLGGGNIMLCGWEDEVLRLGLGSELNEKQIQTTHKLGYINVIIQQMVK